MSFKPEVKVAGNGGKWSQNALVFATRDEAERNARDLFMRWMACEDHRAVEVDEPVSHAYSEAGELKHLEKEPIDDADPA
jgi:hypothetical protein